MRGNTGTEHTQQNDNDMVLEKNMSTEYRHGNFHYLLFSERKQTLPVSQKLF
jgi:hypothetical protein